MTDQSPASLLAIAVAAARDAASVIRDATPRRGAIVWQEKSATDFVSEVDLAAEKRIFDTVRAHAPQARFLAEETANQIGPDEQASGLVFVADPLDGTTNFLHGYPEYAVSIGVLRDGILVAGVVIDIPGGEEFTATLGGGTRLNGEPCHVSATSNPQRTLIGTGFPFKVHAEIAPYQAQMSRVMAGVSGVRRPGAASIDLASVACGRFDAFWENILSPWDIAAGILLVREAGGIATNLQGEPCPVAHTGVIAGNAAMHQWLTATIAAD